MYGETGTLRLALAFILACATTVAVVAFRRDLPTQVRRPAVARVTVQLGPNPPAPGWRFHVSAQATPSRSGTENPIPGAAHPTFTAFPDQVGAEQTVRAVDRAFGGRRPGGVVVMTEGWGSPPPTGSVLVARYLTDAGYRVELAAGWQEAGQ